MDNDKLHIVTIINKTGDGEIYSSSDLFGTLEEAQDKVLKWFNDEMNERDMEGEALIQQDTFHYYWERHFDNEELHFFISPVNRP